MSWGEKMRNIKLIIQYDGTNYHGFQVQAGTDVATVQGVLEEVLSQLTKEKIKVVGAGRTDAGVHARGQVVNFKTGCSIPIDRFTMAVNSLLPTDMVCSSAEEVADDFHASFSSQGKVYTYTLYNSQIPTVFDRHYTYHVPYKLDIPAMRAAAAELLGQHDFAAFRSAGFTVKTSIRTLRRIDIEEKTPLIRITFEADGFLYNMVRIITGTLIEAGRGKLTAAEVKRILESCDRKQAGSTVPPHGLCMERVLY